MSRLVLLVWPFAVVRSHVGGNGGALRKSAVTNVAVERFLTAVSPAMRG